MTIISTFRENEPLIDPETISGVVEILSHPDYEDCDVASSAIQFQNHDDFKNPDFVKVVMGDRNKALYFSRSMVPYQTQETFSSEFSWKHQGIYGYTSDALKKISNLPHIWLDDLEKLEQLRMLFFRSEYLHS